MSAVTALDRAPIPALEQRALTETIIEILCKSYISLSVRHGRLPEFASARLTFSQLFIGVANVRSDIDGIIESTWTTTAYS